MCVLYRFWDIQRQLAGSWNLGQGTGVVEGHWKWHRSTDNILSLVSFPYIGRKSQISHSPTTPSLRETRRNVAKTFRVG